MIVGTALGCGRLRVGEPTDDMYRTLLLTLTCLMTCAVPLAASEPGVAVAPTRLYPEPARYLLLPLGGDRAHFYYTPGSLDRAANLQFRMEIIGRSFERWANERLEYVVYVLNRREWQEAGIDVQYGIPVRIGGQGVAAPARGDAATVELWSELLGGVLPRVVGTPFQGTPQEVASTVTADVLVQLHAGQILVDALALDGDEPWIRPVMAQLAALVVVVRAGTDRPEDLAAFYRQLTQRHPPKKFSVRDYRNDLALEDWLWFQAQFHFGARTIQEKVGKNTLKKMIKLGKKGRLEGTELRRKYPGLGEWLRTSFSAVSFQR